MLGLGILIPPAALDAGWPIPKLRNQASRNPIWLQPIQAAVLGSAKVSVNGELNVTNLIPPVNLATALWTVTKAAEWAVPARPDCRCAGILSTPANLSTPRC